MKTNLKAIWTLWQWLSQAVFIQLLRWPGKGVLWLYWICPNRCWPSMDSDGNTLIGLGRCEQKTLYQGPRSIWKQRVNYKQQGLSTICSALNDVILTLKLPEAHLLRSVFCSVKYPLRSECASSPCLYGHLFTSSPREPLQSPANTDFRRPRFSKIVLAKYRLFFLKSKLSMLIFLPWFSQTQGSLFRCTHTSFMSKSACC